MSSRSPERPRTWPGCTETIGRPTCQTVGPISGSIDRSHVADDHPQGGHRVGGVPPTLDVAATKSDRSLGDDSGVGAGDVNRDLADELTAVSSVDGVAGHAGDRRSSRTISRSRFIRRRRAWVIRRAALPARDRPVGGANGIGLSLDLDNNASGCTSSGRSSDVAGFTSAPFAFGDGRRTALASPRGVLPGRRYLPRPDGSARHSAAWRSPASAGWREPAPARAGSSAPRHRYPGVTTSTVRSSELFSSSEPESDDVVELFIQKR